MDSFANRLAVVTGGGTGMGRELVIQLAAQGCSVASCDVNGDNMGETARRAGKDAPADVRITTHLADVSDEAQMMRFRDEVVAQHDTDHVALLFNNAGIGGGQSFLTGRRDAWDKTFAVCWGGVYNSMRAFADLVVASDDAYVVNTSSVNGFWASLGPGIPHTLRRLLRSERVQHMDYVQATCLRLPMHVAAADAEVPIWARQPRVLGDRYCGANCAMNASSAPWSAVT